MAECARLESVWVERPREFKSHPLRYFFHKPKTINPNGKWFWQFFRNEITDTDEDPSESVPHLSNESREFS